METPASNKGHTRPIGHREKFSKSLKAKIIFFSTKHHVVTKPLVQNFILLSSFLNHQHGAQAVKRKRGNLSRWNFVFGTEDLIYILLSNCLAFSGWAGKLLIFWVGEALESILQRRERSHRSLVTFLDSRSPLPLLIDSYNHFHLIIGCGVYRVCTG